MASPLRLDQAIKAGVYLRISQDRGGEGLGVLRQRDDCMAKAKTLGWPVVDVYEDNDVSAYRTVPDAPGAAPKRSRQSTKKRPQYERMMRDLREGRITAVVVWDVDRLTRHPREIEDFILLADGLGVELASVTGEIDLSTPNGRLMARIKGSVARMESEQKALRQTRKSRELAEAGKPGGGRRPFGFLDDKVTHHPEEQALVAELCARLLVGESLHSIVADLRERRVLTTGGNQWTPQHLRAMLIRPRTGGYREYKPAEDRSLDPPELFEAIWEPLVPRDQWEDLCALLTAPNRAWPRHRKWLLSGLIRCGNCGHRMRSQPSAPGATRGAGYVCAAKHRYGPVTSPDDPRLACAGRYVSSHRAEDWVAGQVYAHVLEHADSSAPEASSLERARLKRQVEQAKARQRELGVLFARRVISEEGLQAGESEAQVIINAANRRLGLAAVRAHTADLGIPTDREKAIVWWASTEPEVVRDQRRVLEITVAAIHVDAATPTGGKFDPARLRITWR